MKYDFINMNVVITTNIYGNMSCIIPRTIENHILRTLLLFNKQNNTLLHHKTMQLAISFVPQRISHVIPTPTLIISVFFITKQLYRSMFWFFKYHSLHCVDNYKYQVYSYTDPLSIRISLYNIYLYKRFSNTGELECNLAKNTAHQLNVGDMPEVIGHSARWSVSREAVVLVWRDQGVCFSSESRCCNTAAHCTKT